MSASERLERLTNFTNPNHGPTPMWVAVEILNALPELVAVVKAAETVAPILHTVLIAAGMNVTPAHLIDHALTALEDRLK